MRILILNHEFPPLGGGAGRVSYEIARELVRAGHAVTVVTTRYGALPSYEVVDNIEVHRVYSKRRNLLDNNIPVTMMSYLLLGTALAQKLHRRQPFDIIQAFFTLPAGLAGLWLKHQTDTPLVVSLHGGDVPHHDSAKFKHPIRMLSPLIAHIWRKADRVTAVSDGLRQTAMRTAPDISCQTIYNGIDTDHFKPADRVSENRTPRLLTVSRLVECKGIHHLLMALARLKQIGQVFNLRIVGDGDHRSHLEQLRNRLGLKDRVTFTGYVPYTELPEVYQQADAFVLPSLTESFGQVFAEAMACGLPVVGTTAGGIPELVGLEQMQWLVEPGDVDALVAKLTAVLQSPIQRQQMGARNAAYMRERFGWTHVAEEHIALYGELIQQKRKVHGDPELKAGFSPGSKLDFSSRLS